MYRRRASAREHQGASLDVRIVDLVEVGHFPQVDAVRDKMGPALGLTQPGFLRVLAGPHQLAPSVPNARVLLLTPLGVWYFQVRWDPSTPDLILPFALHIAAMNNAFFIL